MQLGMRTLPALLLLAAGAAAAQTPHAAVPLTGYLYDSGTRALRAMVGLPGSAILSDSIISGLDAAWPSPNRNHAVVIRDGQTIVLAGLSSLRPSELAGLRLMARPTHVAWSVNGNTAALYDAVEGKVQVLRATSDSAEAEAPVAAVSSPSAATLAVSDTGNVVVATTDGSVYRIGPAGVEPQWPVAAGSLAYCGNSRLYAAVRDDIVELTSSGAVRTIATMEDGVSRVACAGDRLLVLASREQVAVLLSGNGTRLHRVALDRRPAELSPLRGGTVFLLNSVEGEHLPCLILDLKGEPGVFFIPAGGASAW